ncbi:DVU_1553 family AMP-dependent CoA ligase [Sporomusa sp. KB1]|jgi:phenylacetate-coenzyme A ligase PaaK-like adenylate-forming protein|uniref:DVU_1553 family AMP-dependent CoA ligase n=1 Tax=Sporomusa sp. KB1 TaxID=943346 RepID=UPI0011A31035|nr:AMP-binding protein [Sporomusa sp. KB1]TWH48734.1 phenylacetate-coenzyme A ligase PaaK-like adenylate-forming protein [Sporomusa sp. KB1]
MDNTIDKTVYEAWIAKKIGWTGKELTTKLLMEYQLSMLNKVINRAYEHSFFYRRHLKDYGKYPLTSLADLERFSFTTPQDLQTAGLKMVCVNQGEISHVVTLESSGTTGEPKRLYFTSQDQELTVDFFTQSMSMLIRPDEQVYILLPANRPGGVGDLLYQALKRLNAKPVKYGLISSLPEMLENLINQPVSCLVGIPVQILALARYYEHRGEKRKIPLNKILLCTDYVSQAISREIERIWDCEVFDYYGMTEAGLGGGMECGARCGYHLHEADLFFEIVDPMTGRPVMEGQPGEVVISTLTRQGMPLLRYRTGDLSRFIPGRCRCGTILRRLEKVRARKSGLISIGNGGCYITMADLDEALFSIPDVVNFTADVTRQADRSDLKISLYTLSRNMDESEIKQTLSSIPAVGSALAAGNFDIITECLVVTDKISANSGKRKINL